MSKKQKSLLIASTLLIALLTKKSTANLHLFHYQNISFCDSNPSCNASDPCCTDVCTIVGRQPRIYCDFCQGAYCDGNSSKCTNAAPNLNQQRTCSTSNLTSCRGDGCNGQCRDGACVSFAEIFGNLPLLVKIFIFVLFSVPFVCILCCCLVPVLVYCATRKSNDVQPHQAFLYSMAPGAPSPGARSQSCQHISPGDQVAASDDVAPGTAFQGQDSNEVGKSTSLASLSSSESKTNASKEESNSSDGHSVRSKMSRVDSKVLGRTPEASESDPEVDKAAKKERPSRRSRRDCRGN